MGDADTQVAKMMVHEVGLEREGVEIRKEEEDLPKFRGVPNHVTDAALEYIVRTIDNGGDLAKIEYDEVHSAIATYAELLWTLPKLRKELDKLDLKGDTLTEEGVKKYMAHLHKIEMAGAELAPESATKTLAQFSKGTSDAEYSLIDIHYLKVYFMDVLSKRKTVAAKKKASKSCSIL